MGTIVGTFNFQFKIKKKINNYYNSLKSNLLRNNNINVIKDNVNNINVILYY